MDVVSCPALLVLPRSWVARDTFNVRAWLGHWQAWQYAGACLPRAVHVAQAHDGRAFDGDFGELRVYLARLSREQNAFLCGGIDSPDPPLWGESGHTLGVTVEDVYRYIPSPCRWSEARGDGPPAPDPADALTVLLTGAAMRIQAAGDDEGAISAGAGAALAGICSGLTDMTTPDETRPGEFARLWDGISKLVEAGRIAPGEWPDTLAAVPAWLAALPGAFPDVFKTVPVS